MKRLIVIIFIIFRAFLSFSLYRTFAYDTSVVEETPSTTDLEYTFKIGNSSIKQITVDSGETKYYDVVLGNPNPAKISYSIYYEMVSPSSKPDSFSIEYTSKSTGESAGKVDKNGNITLNLVVTNTSSSAVTVKLGSLAGYVNGGELILESGQAVIPKKITASEYIMNLDDGTSGDSGSGVYKVSHDAIASGKSATGNEIKASDDYRYYGDSPNNYICLDMESGSTCSEKHLYRIIGSIYEELEGTNRLKVIKATPLTDGTTSGFSWDYTSSGSSNNNWTTSTLMILLNSGAWWNGTSGSCYNGSTTATTVNFTNYKLSDKAKSYISTSRYYLGGTNGHFGSANSAYEVERGNKTRGSYLLYWNGLVGLMYASDYGYAAGNSCATNTDLGGYGSSCYTKDWLYILDGNASSELESVITINLDDSDFLFKIFKNGSVGINTTSYAGFVRPTFYLDKDVSITSGTGTESDPYLITK